jgi:beta-1,4-mannosyl-glycoprotein beta-1,4-N-acetylglucosaminyltransferase
MEDPPSDIEDIIKEDNENEKNRKILDNSLKRENSQRNQLWEGIKNIHDEELIFSSDLDEIPNIKNFKYKSKINIFLQKVFYYKFNLQQPDFTWYGTRACKKKNLLSFQWLRNIKSKKYPLWRLDILFSKKKYFNINFVEDGGWHFTSIKSPEKIFYKLSNFMHHLEFELSGLNIKNMQELVNQKKILYDHNVDKTQEKYKSEIYLKKVDEKVLPGYLQENKKKFIEWFD